MTSDAPDRWIGFSEVDPRAGGVRIATTSSLRAADALDALVSLGFDFAILHGSSALESTPALSDIDIAVAMPPADLVHDFSDALADHGLHVIVEWNYDVGGATTLFLSTPDAGDGVQLDLVHDVTGVGIDGLITPRVIRQRDAAGRWPRASELHEALYLIRKRARKGNDAAVRDLVDRWAREHSRELLCREAFKMFRAPVARNVCALLEGAPVGSVRRPAAVRSRVTRWAQRIARPVGFWAECDETCAPGVDIDATAQAFARFLPHSGAGRRPRGPAAEWSWFARDVAPVRWRPGVVVSSAAQREHEVLRPDLVVSGAASTAEVQVEIVAAMERRILRAGAARPEAPARRG